MRGNGRLENFVAFSADISKPHRVRYEIFCNQADASMIMKSNNLFPLTVLSSIFTSILEIITSQPESNLNGLNLMHNGCWFKMMELN